MQRYFLFLFLIVLFLSVQPTVSFAGTFFVQMASTTIRVGDTFQVDVMANTQGVNVNAFGGTISFPKNVLDITDIQTGNSIIPLWVESPDATGSVVSFSGIVPGGYAGAGKLFSILFRAKNIGQEKLFFTDTQMLLNDGKGTAVALTATSFSFGIFGAGSTSPATVSILDTIPPQSFVPKIGSDPTLFNGQSFVVFSTTDKESGVASYEVREESQGFFSFAKWIPAVSPYVLIDQKLHSDIFVKAIDKAGNSRIEKIAARYPLPWYEKYQNWFILLLGIVAGYFSLRKFAWKKYIHV